MAAVLSRLWLVLCVAVGVVIVPIVAGAVGLRLWNAVDHAVGVLGAGAAAIVSIASIGLLHRLGLWIARGSEVAPVQLPAAQPATRPAEGTVELTTRDIAMSLIDRARLQAEGVLPPPEGAPRFECPTCSARYWIEWERLRGKQMKIRCQECGGTIDVSDVGSLA